MMNQRYEYKFVRLGEGWLGARKAAMHNYQEVIHEYTREGWRLVQIFAPSFGAYGVSKYVEIVLEKEVGSP